MGEKAMQQASNFVVFYLANNIKILLHDFWLGCNGFASSLGSDFIPRGFAPWDEITSGMLQNHCIPPKSRAITYCFNVFQNVKKSAMTLRQETRTKMIKYSTIWYIFVTSMWMQVQHREKRLQRYSKEKGYKDTHRRRNINFDQWSKTYLLVVSCVFLCNNLSKYETRW